MILTMTTSVTFDDVLRAERAIAAQLPPTPAWSYPGLDAAVGCGVVVKHENTQPTGAFKIRGGIALVEPMVNAVAFFFHEQAWKHFTARPPRDAGRDWMRGQAAIA